MCFKLCLTAAVLAAMLFSTAYAGIAGTDVHVTAKFGTQALDGFTQYELKFLAVGDTLMEYGHSRLRYPFTTYFTGGTVGVEYRGFEANFGYWTDYSYDKNLIMEDFDWGTTITNENIQIAIGYSIPHPEMHFFELDFGYNFRIKSLGIRPFFRYSYYRSEFTMDSLGQYTYYDYENHVFVNPVDTIYLSSAIEVLYYEQDLHLPIVGSNFNLSTLAGKLEMFTNLGFSFFADVNDFDRHPLRENSLTAWNEGSGGSAILLELGARCNIFQGLWINALAGYSDYQINTNGTQRTVTIIPGQEPQVQRVTGIDTQVRGVMRRYQITLSYMFPL